MTITIKAATYEGRKTNSSYTHTIHVDGRRVAAAYSLEQAQRGARYLRDGGAIEGLAAVLCG